MVLDTERGDAHNSQGHNPMLRHMIFTCSYEVIMYLLFILPVSLFPLEAFNFLGRVGLSFVPLEDEGRPNGFKAMTVTQKKHQSVNISDSGYVQSLASAVPVYSDALRKSFNRMIVNNRHRSNIS